MFLFSDDEARERKVDMQMSGGPGLGPTQVN